MIDKKFHLPQNISNILMMLSGTGIFIFFLIQLSAYYNDDAYIILRYANNFLMGDGLVWNLGEKVEGYSCFLWLMLISFLGYLKIDLVFASKLLGVFFAFSTFLSFFIFNKDKRFNGALLLASNSCFALWAVGGLETVAFGFFLFFGCYLFFVSSRRGVALFPIGIIFCLATMTRPEGGLFFIITLLFIILKDSQFTPTNIKSALLFIAGFSCVYLPFFVWRLYYYGYLFPCTFYVKGGINIFKLFFGGRYIFHFLIMYGPPLIILIFVRNWRTFFSKSAYLITLLLVYTVYIFVIGGDHMQGFRFFVPILPLFYLLVQEGFFAYRFGQDSFIYIALVILITGLNFITSYRSIPQGPEATIDALSHSYKYRTCIRVPEQAAYAGKFIGLYMKDHWPRGTLVAGNAAGAIPYYSGMAFIDMLGLTDYNIAKREISYEYKFLIKDLLNIKNLFSWQKRLEIKQKIFNNYLVWRLIPGHEKGDGTYVLSRKPDFIILGPGQGSTIPWFLGDLELLNSAEFKKKYQLNNRSIEISDDYFRYFEPTKTGFLKFAYYERQ